MGGKTQEIVLDIGAAGATEGMHFEDFDLGFLGKKKVTRASEIFHNEETQKWDIILPGDKEPVSDMVTGFNGYDEARNFEVSWLQECRKQQEKPGSVVGISIAIGIRTNMCQCGGGDCSECPR